MGDYLVTSSWKKNRSRTTIMFGIQSLLLGIEYTITFLSLWIYIEEELHVQYPTILYSMVAGSYLTSAVVSSIIVSTIIDRYRNVKLIFIITNAVVTFGNLIYSIPVSPLCLFFGRLLSGSGGLLRSVIVSEITRIYPHHKLSSYFSIMGMAYALGFIVGPLINLMFLNINITFIGLKISYLNCPSIFLAFMFACQCCLSFFFVKDCSKEVDLKTTRDKKICYGTSNVVEENGVFKEDTMKMDEKIIIIKSNGTKKYALYSILKNIDIIIILLSSYFATTFIVTIEMWWPLLIIKVIGWSAFELNITSFASSVFSVLCCLILIFKRFSDKQIFQISIVSMLALTSMSFCLLLMKTYNKSNTFNIFIWSLFCLCFPGQVVIEDIFLVNSLSKMVASKYQTFADSMRLSCSRLGALIAMLIAPYLSPQASFIAISFIVLFLFSIIVFMIRRKNFMEPKILVW